MEREKVVKRSSTHFPQVQFQDNPSDGAVFVLQYVENFLKVSQRSEVKKPLHCLHYQHQQHQSVSPVAYRAFSSDVITFKRMENSRHVGIHIYYLMGERAIWLDIARVCGRIFTSRRRVKIQHKSAISSHIALSHIK